MTMAIEDLTQVNRRGMDQYVIEVGSMEIKLFCSYELARIKALEYAARNSPVRLRYQDNIDMEEKPSL